MKNFPSLLHILSGSDSCCLCSSESIDNSRDQQGEEVLGFREGKVEGRLILSHIEELERSLTVLHTLATSEPRAIQREFLVTNQTHGAFPLLGVTRKSQEFILKLNCLR